MRVVAATLLALIVFPALLGAVPAAAGGPMQAGVAPGAAAAPLASLAPQGLQRPQGPARFDPEAATAAYLAQLSPAARARSDAYFEGGYWLILWDLVAGLAAAWLLLATGISARVRDWAERATRWAWPRVALYAAVFLVLNTLLLLPWNAYEDYFREHQYGMSNQDLAAWLGDQGKGLIIALIGGILALPVVYAVLRKAPRTWWLWGSLVGIAFSVFVLAIAPVYLEPVFNKFSPLPASPLKQEILATARANGIPATDVYQFDASKQTKRMSAHVSGLLGTTRISLNDNLLRRGSPEEIEAVLGHEMGHYVLNHVYKGMLFIAIWIVAGFAFLRWSFDRLQRRLGTRWGIRGIADVAALPLLIALLEVFFFVLTPVTNSLTRTMEAEADNYGLNVSRQPDGFAQAAMHLAEYRKMQPGALEELIFFDHPSGWHRIHRAMVWKAEHLGDPDIAAYDAAHPPAGAGVLPSAPAAPPPG